MSILFVAVINVYQITRPGKLHQRREVADQRRDVQFRAETPGRTKTPGLRMSDLESKAGNDGSSAGKQRVVDKAIV